jgi:hypothetical protein
MAVKLELQVEHNKGQSDKSHIFKQ